VPTSLKSTKTLFRSRHCPQFDRKPSVQNRLFFQEDGPADNSYDAGRVIVMAGPVAEHFIRKGLVRRCVRAEITGLMINRKTLLRCAVLASLCVFTLGLSNQLLAQQPGQAPPPASPQTQPATPQSQPTAPQTQPAAPQAQAKPTNDLGTTQIQPAPDPKVPQNDRILWTLPNYLTVENASSLPPLTTGQKLKLVAEGTFDPIEFAFLALEAGVNQASNTNPTFGQGVKGYAKRYALAFGDNTVENFMVAAVFASGLRQDPRYYQMGKGKFLRRVEYAASRVVVTRSDSGKNEFNSSEIFGAASAAAISNAYHPGPRTFGNSANVWVTQMGWDAVGFEMKEFWPDVHRYLARHHNKT